MSRSEQAKPDNMYVPADDESKEGVGNQRRNIGPGPCRGKGLLLEGEMEEKRRRNPTAKRRFKRKKFEPPQTMNT